MLKLALVLGIGYMIYNHIENRNVESSIMQLKSEINNYNWLVLIGVLLLMPFNWLLESKKWHTCMSHYHTITLRTSIYSILSGITCGLLTPARIGEYFGRLLVVDAVMNKASLYSSFLCSVAQNVITLTVGIIGGIYFCSQVELVDISSETLIISNVVVVILALLTYYYHGHIIRLLDGTRFYAKHLSFISEQKISTSILVRLLWLSTLRYAVYVIQYYGVLCLLGLSQNPIMDITAISTIYLIQSTLPLPPFLGFLARGEIAVLIFSYFSYDPIFIMIATTVLWVINLIIPALLGIMIITRSNITKAISS